MSIPANAPEVVQKMHAFARAHDAYRWPFAIDACVEFCQRHPFATWGDALEVTGGSFLSAINAVGRAATLNQFHIYYWSSRFGKKVRQYLSVGRPGLGDVRDYVVDPGPLISRAFGRLRARRLRAGLSTNLGVMPASAGTGVTTTTDGTAPAPAPPSPSNLPQSQTTLPRTPGHPGPHFAGCSVHSPVPAWTLGVREVRIGLVNREVGVGPG